jgi:hypothetical protein
MLLSEIGTLRRGGGESWRGRGSRLGLSLEAWCRREGVRSNSPVGTAGCFETIFYFSTTERGNVSRSLVSSHQMKSPSRASPTME